jgi:hypothetical protein
MKLGMTPEPCRVQHGSFDLVVFGISRMAWQKDWPHEKGCYFIPPNQPAPDFTREAQDCYQVRLASAVSAP